MADNVAITAGSGTTIAADDVGAGVLVQRVKTTWGPDGTANDTDVASGKPLPVQIRSSGGTEASLLTSVAHDAIDAGDPLKMGARAIAHGTNPTAVAAADRTDLYASRAGVLFVVGGHPNVVTRDNVVLDSDGAQTDAALVSVAGGLKIVVTQISAVCSAANTGNIAVRIGFGAANVPAAALAGTAALLINGTFGAGGGQQKGNGAGILGVGADGEDLRLTCGDPAGGALYVTYSYYTIES